MKWTQLSKGTNLVYKVSPTISINPLPREDENVHISEPFPHSSKILVASPSQ